MDLERVIEELAAAGPSWQNRAAELVANLPRRSLEDLVRRIIAGMRGDRKLLVAGARLASVPLVASSSPELVLGLLDLVKDPNNTSDDIRDAIPYVLENAAEIVVPEDPRSVELAEAILTWCPREPRVCGLLEKCSCLVDEERLPRVLISAVSAAKDSADFREIAKALKLLEESPGRLDTETRQKLLEALINKVENGIVDVKDIAPLLDALGGRDAALLAIAASLTERLSKGDIQEQAKDMLDQIREVEDRLIKLLEENPQRKDLAAALERLYKAKIKRMMEYMRSGNIPCSIAKDFFSLVYKPIVDLRKRESWKAASLAARIFLKTFLGEKKYETLRDLIRKLNSIPIYHPWTALPDDLLPDDLQDHCQDSYGSWGASKSDPWSYLLCILASELINYLYIKYTCIYKEKDYKGYDVYRRREDYFPLDFNNVHLVLLAVALGFRSIEAYARILLEANTTDVDTDSALESVLKRRLLELEEACMNIGGCAGLEEMHRDLPIVIQILILTDKIIRKIIGSIKIEKDVIPINGGSLSRVKISVQHPISIENIIMKSNDCRVVWESGSEVEHQVYLFASGSSVSGEELTECLRNYLLCLNIKGLGGLCFDGSTIEANHG